MISKEEINFFRSMNNLYFLSFGLGKLAEWVAFEEFLYKIFPIFFFIYNYKITHVCLYCVTSVLPEANVVQ